MKAIKLNCTIAQVTNEYFQEEVTNQVNKLYNFVTVEPSHIIVTSKTVKFIWTAGVGAIVPEGFDYYELGVNLHFKKRDKSKDVQEILWVMGSVWTHGEEGDRHGGAFLLSTLPQAGKVRDQLIEWLLANEDAKKALKKTSSSVF